MSRFLCADYLLDDKLEADQTDRDDHAALQPFADFVCEKYLIDRGCRQLAEIGVFEFLRSLRKHLKSPKVQLIAHFLNVLDSPDNQLFAFMAEQLLNVLNRARKKLVAVPAPPSAAPTTDRSPEEQERRHYYFEQTASGDWTPLRHAIKIVRRTCHFLPFRKMIRFIRLLEAAAYIRITKVSVDPHAHRHVDHSEYSAKYEPQSVLTRGCVRGAIRNAILDLGESVASYMGTESSDPAATTDTVDESHHEDGLVALDQTAVIDVYEALHILVKIVALRRRPVEDKLRRLYLEADENRDGMLSFDEFKDLIESASQQRDADAGGAGQDRKPMTNRRIVRMYREAQEFGGSSGAISRDDFIRICGRYGFIPFVELEEGDDKT